MIIEEYKLSLETSYMPLNIKARKIENGGVEENKKIAQWHNPRCQEI